MYGGPVSLFFGEGPDANCELGAIIFFKYKPTKLVD